MRTAVFIKKIFSVFFVLYSCVDYFFFFKDSISIDTCRLKGPRRHPVLLSLADLGANAPYHS